MISQKYHKKTSHHNLITYTWLNDKMLVYNPNEGHQGKRPGVEVTKTIFSIP